MINQSINAYTMVYILTFNGDIEWPGLPGGLDIWIVTCLQLNDFDMTCSIFADTFC